DYPAGHLPDRPANIVQQRQSPKTARLVSSGEHSGRGQTSHGMVLCSGEKAMTWFWQEFIDWLPALVTLFYIFLTVGTLTCILMTKTDATSAVAWCLLIIFLPFVGSVFFYFFGWQHIDKPLERKKRHKLAFRFPGHRPGSGSF